MTIHIFINQILWYVCIFDKTEPLLLNIKNTLYMADIVHFFCIARLSGYY